MLSLLVLVKGHALPALKDRTITSNSNKCSLHALAPLPLSYLHLGSLLPAADGVVFKGELVLTNDGPAVLVSHVGHHVHVRGPQLKLPLPVDDGGQGGAHQEGPFGVALGPSGKGKGWSTGCSSYTTDVLLSSFTLEEHVSSPPVFSFLSLGLIPSVGAG